MCVCVEEEEEQPWRQTAFWSQKAIHLTQLQLFVVLLLRLLCCCEYLKNSHISSKSKGDLFGGNVLYGLYSTGGGGGGGLVLSFNHNSLHTIPNLSLCSYKAECIKHIFLTVPSISNFHVLTTLCRFSSHFVQRKFFAKKANKNCYFKILIFVTFWPFLNTLHKKLTFYQIMSVNKKDFTINKTKYKTQFHCIHNSN